jgi:hypothetical protein
MSEPSCSWSTPDLAGVEAVCLSSGGDFQAARMLAEGEASRRFAEYLLISWYDRERDFESPAHVSECAGNGPKNGYIHYALSHGARLKVEVDGGRFVFFYTPVAW